MKFPILKSALFLSIIALFIGRYNNLTKNNQYALISNKIKISLSPKPTLETLNGVDASKAKTMINNFSRDIAIDAKPKSFSTWFTKAEIHQMLVALKKETTADGVRIYLGEESIQQHRLILQTLLIPTRKLNPISSNPKISKHEDYYLNNSLINNKLGVDFNNDAIKVLKAGGLLYGDKKPNITNNCTVTNNHQIDADSAYNRIRRRHNAPGTPGKPSEVNTAYTTKSVWYDKDFIIGLFTAIDNSNSTTNLDGLRIYLSLSIGNINNTKKDAFILIPTHKVSSNLNIHEDDYNCLNLKVANATLAPTTRLTAQASRGSNAHDNGELCPDVCNVK